MEYKLGNGLEVKILPPTRHTFHTMKIHMIFQIKSELSVLMTRLL